MQSVKWSSGQVQMMQELRRSNAAGLHKSKKSYDRKQKHKGKGWE